MPKIDKASSSHRNSVSTVSAAGASGTRSSSWSAKDDETLIQARAQGLNWNQIGPKHFPTKTPNACRKRHERLMERQNAEQWDGVKLDVLAQAYMEVRREMWSILAARVGEKWQLVEQKCMEKGLKNLTQADRSARKKQNDESEDHHTDLPNVSEAHYPTYPGGFPSQQRVPSIQSMLQPMQIQQPALQQHSMQHPMQQQPLQQQPMQQQSMQQQSMQQHHMHHMSYSHQQ
ncbi:NAD-dependent protein deacylase sir2rp2 [Coniothyrium glycines]